ncbi:SET domain-containing protein isoform X2 [Tasmannia lanceolata]|uniref:SET domain-containing protein isoform X2 n=1 Tax=Tasmannia lanceolata TaxID=3420 RepID=UPI004063D4A1
MEGQEEAKLDRFLHWLQVNGVELRGCNIRYCGPNKGFGIFSTNDDSKGILLVSPLDLAITPMRVLQDPTLGPKCRAMLEEGDVDDRFLMILFLTMEHVRKNSSWKPYLDMLPTTFGTPLWFTDEELSELKGTTLYRATELQKKKLQALFSDKVKHVVQDLLDGELEREVCFEDFLWANSIFWARALNIPLPRSYVFPQSLEDPENCFLPLNKEFGASLSQISGEVLSHGKDENGSHSCEGKREGTEATSTSTQPETIWVEGLVPGIDFCNHDIMAAATWEVDETGSTTGVPSSMYLLSAERYAIQTEKEICISYGNKGNEVHYPIGAFQSDAFADSKARLLEIQKTEMRCLLPRNLLDHGFFSGSPPQDEDRNKYQSGQHCNYSWSGQRKVPCYLNKLVFPENFLTALRTIAMEEEELNQVSSLLEELVGCGEERPPSDIEVKAAVWEACGDSGALQMLVDLLHMKMLELEEGSGKEACDNELLEKACVTEIPEEYASGNTDCRGKEKLTSRNMWSSIVYRKGQKQLTRLFLKEAEHALQLCLSEQQ